MLFQIQQNKESLVDEIFATLLLGPCTHGFHSAFLSLDSLIPPPNQQTKIKLRLVTLAVQ